ncbi:hypothetical protein SAMN05444515_10696 [Ectothiorhodospira marina]|jgi:hypothetical protein|uniref:Uncharacterized protein n=1 Tax=Ectothiorhodospira marina TaxID=1396821 RepID=A0A1H7KRX6_9GAMM|nr:hypothetical protein SAMN05444515_10696 [Ectothiorhodospira marina]
MGTLPRRPVAGKVYRPAPFHEDPPMGPGPWVGYDCPLILFK